MMSEEKNYVWSGSIKAAGIPYLSDVRSSFTLRNTKFQVVPIEKSFTYSLKDVIMNNKISE